MYIIKPKQGLVVKKEYLEKLIHENLYLKDIAKKEGCSPSKISYWVRKHNIKNDLRRSWVNDRFLDIIKEKQAYFLGLIASDGCIKSDRYFSISQSHQDGKKLLKKFKKLLAQITF